MRNRGMEAVMEEVMGGPIPEEFQEMAQSLGLSKSATMAEFTDHMRVHANAIDPSQLKGYLADIAGWDVEIEAESAIRQGDRIGSVRVEGKKTPIFAHMGLTGMFDRTDPPLEKLFASVQKERKKAIVLHALPRFYIDADASGDIRCFLLQGGWHLENNVWSPFLLTAAGPDDISAQRRFLKPGAPSRGLLRERGFEPDALRRVQEFQRTIKHMAREEAEEPAKDAKLRLMTDSEDWSAFGSDKAREMHKELMSSLGTPKPAARSDAPPSDAKDLIARAPRGLVDAVRANAPDQEILDGMLYHLAILTNGFEGLSEQVCENLGVEDVSSLIRCATAEISPMEMAWWLGEVFKWDIAAVFDGGGSDKGDEGLCEHGDVLLAIEVEGQEEPVPVMFHGGWLDPLDAAEDFSFLASRLSAQVRFKGGPGIIIPTSIHMRTRPEDKPVWEGGGNDALAIMIGYAFDGAEWYPISLGQPGSNPFENRLTGADLRPESDSGYTGPLTFEMGDSKLESQPPISAVAMMQLVIDRHHDLGPEVETPRDIDPQEDYRMVGGDNWVFFQDQGQAAIYPEPGE